jgi:hypothetical protein
MKSQVLHDRIDQYVSGAASVEYVIGDKARIHTGGKLAQAARRAKTCASFVFWGQRKTMGFYSPI